MAGLRDFKKVAGDGADIGKLQERLQEFFAQFATNPLLDGAILEATLGTSLAKVPHKLARKPIGFLVVDADGPSMIWTGTKDAFFIELAGSAAVKVKLWIF